MSSTARRWLLVLGPMVIYLVVGGYLSRTLGTWDDEAAYLGLGRLAVTGQISLFQDDLTGQRMPLPFYVLGATQVIFGRDLWAGRLMSLTLGLSVLGLTFTVARQVHGEIAGSFAALLLATQGVIVGYYATATYHALTAVILMAAVWLLLKRDLPWRHAIGMAIASLLFVTRTNMFPAIPFFFVWALWGARGVGERLAVVLVTVAPPVIFFSSDPTHLKLLAHVPLLNHLVEPLGYRSILTFSPIHHASLRDQLWALALFARRYESWAVAAVGLALAAVAARPRPGSARVIPENRKALAIVGGLFLWCLAWHFVILRVNFRYAIPFFSTYAPLGAVILGVGFAEMLPSPRLPRLARLMAGLALLLSLTVSLIWIRHPLLPLAGPRPFRGDAIQQLNASAARLDALVPGKDKVFVFAPPMLAYLAGLNPPLQQVMSPGGTLVPAGSDARLVAKNGVWGAQEIERWLGEQAEYAVLSRQLLKPFEAIRPESVGRIHELLQERFALVESLAGTSQTAADVYRRLGIQKVR
jgi:hypothetical protein